jgi:hypothetical protein
MLPGFEPQVKWGQATPFGHRPKQQSNTTTTTKQKKAKIETLQHPTPFHPGQAGGVVGCAHCRGWPWPLRNRPLLASLRWLVNVWHWLEVCV